MSEILCEWLNDEVKLSQSVDPGLLSEKFSTGYLLGELLHKYGLQDNFNQFSQSRAANAMLNNFSLLEPTFHLCGVQYNANVASDIMIGKHGAAKKLLYELYVALEKKRKTKLTGVAMEAMRPAAPARLKSSGNVLFREHLKSLTSRHTDLELQQIYEHFEMKPKAIEDKTSHVRISEQQKSLKLQEEQRVQDTGKHRTGRRQNEIMAGIQAAIIQVPKSSLSHTSKANEAKKFLKKKREAEDTYKEINKFEKTMLGNALAVHSQVTDSEIQGSLQTQNLQETSLETAAQTATEPLPSYSNDEYVRKIQQHKEEDMFAREREKRRRKMLMEQLIAHETEQEIYQEEQLIYRLMRQSQQERRIAVQLMHVRHEKEVLKQNRIFRQKQYEERRLKDFQEALDREAALAKQKKIDCEEQIVKERELYEKMAVERAQARYKKHYSLCWDVIDQIVDLSTKLGEYRVLTNSKVPLKLISDWKELFFNGKSIYEKASIKPLPSEPSPEELEELSKMDLLDEKDYSDYKNMTGEWCPTEEDRENKSPLNNDILGHVLHRLMEIFYPSKPRSSPSVVPPFPIKGCILGKLFSGKTTCAKFLEKVCNIQVLSVATLVQEAIQALLNNEMKTEQNLTSQEAESSPKQNEVQKNSESSVKFLTETFTNGTKDNHAVKTHPSDEEIVSDHKENDISKLSVRAQLGAASQKLLKKGKSITDELLVDILLEAIKQTPPEKGWILDGFPMTVNQAKLFEKAYTGNDPDEMEPQYVNCGKPKLVTNPMMSNEPTVSLPAFDVVVLLAISDTTVLKRVARLKRKSKPSQMEQEDNNQNSDAKIVEQKIDLVRDQILHRISGFQDTWPKLENWLSVHQNTVVKVNAETEESIMCKTVKEILIEEIDKKQKRSVQEKSPEEKALPVTPQDFLSPISVTPPLIKPTTDECIYVDEPLPKEIPDFLVPYWEVVENVYVNTVKTILRCLRDEQYSMIHYLADIRKNFQDYLKRPDFKQEFVSQWQSDFNSISDDLREDEETKAELHQRVTDLRDLLWDICDKRREEAEQECTDIMNDGWLRDHNGIAINHFLSLMQVELDRFQDTKGLLQDYYGAMEGKIPEEDKRGFTRLPLLGIINEEQKEVQNESRRMPLVSYKLPSPETDIAKSKNKGFQLKSAKDENSENVLVTSVKNENLISDTWQKAVTAVSEMVRAEELKEIKKEEKQLEVKEGLKSSQTKSGKSGKNAKKPQKSPKSPTKKKGPHSVSPVAEESPVPSTSELKNRELTLKIQQEYFAALKHEEKATKTRLKLIKEKALAFVEELTLKAEEAYRDMEKWLAARFLAEISSVEKLIEVGRHYIECSSKIQYEMNLEDTDFFINSDVKVIPDCVPPQVPLVETSDSILTISQLNTLHKHFLQVAPKGFIHKEVFIEIFIDLINSNLGTNYLPNAWMNLTLPDIQNLTNSFTTNTELIDWRRFMLSAAQPWPVPSVTQLLKTLHDFMSVDVDGSGFVTLENYMQVGLWFKGNEDLNMTEDCTKHLCFDRLGQLLKFFFSLFADTGRSPALLNYSEMLLYFASHSDPIEGVYRALSVATGTYIHRKEETSLLCETFPYTKIEEDENESLNYRGEGAVSLATLLKVFHDGGSRDEDYHRFSRLETEGSYDKHFTRIYKELGNEDLTPLPVELLLKHCFIQDLIKKYQGYKLHDINLSSRR
ncbi:sperm flagellar protein 2 [Cyrtonyx montezumae]|uniref:sperm flagellar protein 2 n=1 Tax=Cyrtonyx montezumae TaxID=9017 RepID=UPI0032D9C2AF